MNQLLHKKLILIILDGWGTGQKYAGNAINLARTPVFDQLIVNHPVASLKTSGEAVGLPEGQMGNSEVGHLNIGAGRVVYQDLVKINLEIRNNRLKSNAVLMDTLNYCKREQKALHLIGLVSDGGVHSHIDHLISLIKIAEQTGVKSIYIHAFTDGRDTDPQSGKLYLKKLTKEVQTTHAIIASIIGRYYAMDRDQRWERIKLAYDLLVNGTGITAVSPVEVFENSYNNGITDEFISAHVLDPGNQSRIRTGDAVICFNFRTDRCRQLTQALTRQNFSEHDMKPLDLRYVTMTRYDDRFDGIDVLFEKDNLPATLGEIISLHGLSQLRIAETEKYPHVTFFFSGGREDPFPLEKRIMIPSPKVATYDLQPEMSAMEVTKAVLQEIKSNKPDFICLNFANPDMVGHTGNLEAVVKAIETVDQCTGDVVKCGVASGYSLLITADHGNAEYMINDDGSPNTAHTTLDVPLILIDADHQQIRNGKLADLAPTILEIMGLKKPDEMTGESLL